MQSNANIFILKEINKETIKKLGRYLQLNITRILNLVIIFQC